VVASTIQSGPPQPIVGSRWTTIVFGVPLAPDASFQPVGLTFRSSAFARAASSPRFVLAVEAAGIRHRYIRPRRLQHNGKMPVLSITDPDRGTEGQS